MKCLKVIVLSAVLLLSLESVSSAEEFQPAHNLYPCNPGGQSSGYIVNCGAPYGHAGTIYITFTDALLPSAYSGYVDTAVTRWNSTGVVRLTRVLSSRNTIYRYYDPNGDSNASVKNTVPINSLGHKVSWEMKFNGSYMDSRAPGNNQNTATHEFGHTIGLGNLKNDLNKNKIMYSGASRTVITPQAADITGAKEAVR